jgi:hypothetical protein
MFLVVEHGLRSWTMLVVARDPLTHEMIGRSLREKNVTLFGEDNTLFQYFDLLNEVWLNSAVYAYSGSKSKEGKLGGRHVWARPNFPITHGSAYTTQHQLWSHKKAKMPI